MSIVSIVAREILDSRGNPTVEVDLRTEKGDRWQACLKISEKKNKHNPHQYGCLLRFIMSEIFHKPSLAKQQHLCCDSKFFLTSNDLHVTSVRLYQFLVRKIGGLSYNVGRQQTCFYNPTEIKTNNKQVEWILKWIKIIKTSPKPHQISPCAHERSKLDMDRMTN